MYKNQNSIFSVPKKIRVPFIIRHKNGNDKLITTNFRFASGRQSVIDRLSIKKNLQVTVGGNMYRIYRFYIFQIPTSFT